MPWTICAPVQTEEHDLSDEMKKRSLEALNSVELLRLRLENKRLRNLLHEVEANADPAGRVREAVAQKENAKALEARLALADALAEAGDQALPRLERCDEKLDGWGNEDSPVTKAFRAALDAYREAKVGDD